MIHVSIAFFSYAAFTLSFILALFYLFQHALLKKKKWGPRFRRLPNLMKLDVYQVRLNLVGLPLLVLSLILGAVWAFYTMETSVLADAKVVLSVLVTLAYAVYFYQRAVSGWSAKKMATLNACNFGFLLINYIVTSNVSDFHI
jgi:HemX protein